MSRSIWSSASTRSKLGTRWLCVGVAALLLHGVGSALAQDRGGEAPSTRVVPPKNVDVSAAEKLLSENKGIVILDVRTPEEYKKAHLAGSTNINFHAPDFDQKVGALDKGQTYLVHCAVGGRSAKACDKMSQMQFKSLYNLEGGIKAWEKAGKPVEH